MLEPVSNSFSRRKKNGVSTFLVLSLVALLVASAASVARADFVGELVLMPMGCESTGHCELGEDFGFIDPSGVGWQAAKGLITDGPAYLRGRSLSLEILSTKVLSRRRSSMIITAIAT
jgi:hypothetical protein